LWVGKVLGICCDWSNTGLGVSSRNHGYNVVLKNEIIEILHEGKPLPPLDWVNRTQRGRVKTHIENTHIWSSRNDRL
jgi:hypothetical protein